MKTIARIRENDESTGKIIRIGLIKMKNEYGKGYRLAASNGDDISYYMPQTEEKCMADMRASWGKWDTYEEVTP